MTTSATEQLVRAALAAPSMHNTQPWRFEPADDGALVVRVDWERHLAIGDPDGRGIYLATGAALLNMRLTARALGYDLDVTHGPDPADATVLARVGLGGPSAASVEDQALAHEITHRHTNRYPFRDLAIPRRVRERMERAAKIEGTILRRVAEHEIGRVLSLVRQADRRLQDNPNYVRELRHWTAGDESRRDGVPPSAFGPVPADRRLPVRNFGLAITEIEREVAEFEKSPEIYVLATGEENPRAWLSAGCGLQRVLLTASLYGVSASFMSQPVQLPEPRARLRSATVSPAYPQMVLRLGYGRAVDGPHRRLVNDVLVRGRSTTMTRDDSKLFR